MRWKEHYTCTQIGKKHKQEFRDGTLTFKCVQCCLPGLILDDIFIEANEDAKSKSQEKKTRENTSDSVKADPALFLAMEELSKQNDETQRKMEGIIMDNTMLTNEIKKLMEEKNKLLHNNNNLAAEFNKMKQDYSNLQIDYNKAKDSALNNQTTLRARAKEAKVELEKCEIEIAKQQKQIDQLRAENSTYKDLIVYQKARVISEPEPKNLTVAVRKVTKNGKVEEERTVSNNEDQLSLHDNPEQPDAVGEDHRIDGVRFCHFYNRKGCSKPDCIFLHKKAPLCKNHLRGKCTRRFCMFSHQGQDFYSGKNVRPREQKGAELKSQPSQEDLLTVKLPENINPTARNPDQQLSSITDHLQQTPASPQPQKKENNSLTSNQCQEQTMSWQPQTQQLWQYPPFPTHQNQNQWYHQQWNNPSMQHLNYQSPYPFSYPAFSQSQLPPPQYMKMNQ